MSTTATPIDSLIVVRGESSALIRSEVLASTQRARLERAVHDAVNKLGHTIDEVSEASGLTPAEVRRIAAKVPELDAMLLAGTAD